MADPATSGIPTITPDAGAAPSQRTSATAASFGGATAQATQELGQTALKVADYFGEVQVDDQANQLFDRWNKRLRGDANQMVPSPDGTMQPDTGYMGLRGRTALDARQKFEADLDIDLKEIRKNLVTPRQQAKFDDQTRRYRQHVVGLAGSHAEREAQTYATNVNRSSSSIALNRIAVAPLDPEQVASGTADLIAARIKEAQILGGGPELLQAAEQGAKRDALKVQLQAVSATDPERAMRMLDKNKEIAGIEYDNLHREFRTRADTETGNRAGERAVLATYTMQPPAATVVPVFDQAAAKSGVSATYLMRTWQLESGGRLNPPDSETGAKGPFQVVGSTAREYGLSNPHDFVAATDTAARLAANNKARLTATLGRVPTDAELYLAHQQGAGGASKLLSNPTARAGDLVGDKAIRVNGGDPNATAADFTSKWAARFNGAGVTAQNLTARKQAAYDTIESDPSLSDAARQRARAYLNQQFQALQIAEGVTAAAKREANDNAANGYMTRLLSRNPLQMSGIYEQITADENLDWRTKNALAQMAEKHLGSDTQAASESYGPGFWEAWKAVTAPVSDPKRITDITQLMERAGPGGDLTIAGVEKLGSALNAAKKSPDAQAVHSAQTGLMNYAKSKLSFAQDMGPIKIPDPKGEAIFNGEFIPKFQAAYAEWIKAGKNPWEFLTRENVDKMVTGMRPKGEMEMARVAATGEVMADKAAPAPPAPEKIDKAAWEKVISTPLTTADGKPFPKAALGQALTWLINNPTPEGIKTFNESKFGKTAKLDGQKVLEQLGVTKPEPSAGDLLGYKIRKELHPGEDKFFKENPTVTGMAAETGDIILNPYASGNVNKTAVAKNEAFRLYLRDNKITPDFPVTAEQKAKFADTSYGKDDVALKSTIAARIFSGDPSAMATKEQKQWVEDQKEVIKKKNTPDTRNAPHNLLRRAVGAAPIGPDGKPLPPEPDNQSEDARARARADISNRTAARENLVQ